MATLRTLSNLNGSARGQAALGILLDRALLLRFLEQQSGFELDATTFDSFPIDGSGTLQTRAIGGAFNATDKAPPARVGGQLAIYGDKINIDISHRADARQGLRDMDVWIEREASRRVRDLAAKLDAAVMNDPGTGTTMKGLSKILDGATDIPGFAGKKGVIDARSFGGSGNSFDLTAAATAAQHDAFIEGLEKALIEVPDCKGIVVNRTLAARITTVARRAHMLGESRDLFGRPVPSFNGVPIYSVSDTAIPVNEPSNGGTPTTDTTSLYLLNPGEGRLSVVTNEGLYYQEWDHLEAKESSQEMFELRMAWKVEDPDAVRRVRNIKV